VAGLPTAELEELVQTDEAAAAPVRAVGVRAGVGRSASDHLEACLQAVLSLDGELLERELARAAVSLTVPQLLEQLLLPLLRQIGDGWHDGSLRIAHEHMASAVVRSFLGSMRSNEEMPGARSRILITTPVGQLHELGALMAAVTAGIDGWQAIFLGANLPAEEIAAALLQRDARVLALSIVHAADHAALTGELKKIRRLAPEETVILVGGAAAHRYEGALKEIGAIRVGDLTQFRGELDRIGEAIA
jgi:methanogenic corrinoid protein MtbC1